MSIVNPAPVEQSSLDRAAKMLAGIDGGLEKAMRDAASRAASKIRSGSTAAVRERYAISAAEVRSNAGVKIRYDYKNGVNAEVSFHGRKIPLYRFAGATPAQPAYDTSRWVKVPVRGEMAWVHPGCPASGHQLRSTSPARFENAFVARMKTGHVGIFERNGSATSDGGDAVKEIMGSAVPQMVGSEEVREKLLKDAAEKFEERLDHNVMAILSGYMR